MCKKVFVLFLALMISLSVSACSGFSDSDMDIYEKIHKHYNKMESYTADVDVTVYSNKTENRYFVAQKVKSPDMYYTHITDEKATFGVTTVSKGGKTKTVADGSEYSMTVPDGDSLGVLYLNNFFKAYYASEETSLSVQKSLKSKKTMLSVEIFDENTAIKKVNLSIDNKTLAPVSISVYGDEDLLLMGTFENFRYNEKIDDSLFNTD